MKRLFLIISLFLFSVNGFGQKPEVFVFSDINLVGGDPDDRQSFVHLLWYLDDLELKGFVADYWNGENLEACELALDAYDKDLGKFRKGGYPSKEWIRARVFTEKENAIKNFTEIALNSAKPLYVLMWGNMKTLKEALFQTPEIAENIRVISIGTGVKYGPKDDVLGKACNEPNWNGNGRNEIFNNSDFNNMWWLEINWTYNGMFRGDEPAAMYEKLQKYGAMGKHIKEATAKHPWAQYFRVGDTPSVLYVIDPQNNLEDPSKGSWAGRFYKPFPQERPNFFTDVSDDIDWDYANPCNTWKNASQVYQYCQNTLVSRRQRMYDSLIKKLEELY